MSEYDYRPLKDLIHDSEKGGVQDLGKTGAFISSQPAALLCSQQIGALAKPP